MFRLSLACEELRIYGHFSKLTEKIEELPDDLVDLQCDILKRLEEEQPQEELLVATLCFLLVSQAGTIHKTMHILQRDSVYRLRHSARELLSFIENHHQAPSFKLPNVAF